MLIGARMAGFDVVGNIEWRKYYHYRDADGKNTFEENYPGAIFKPSLDAMTEEEIERMSNADIAFGHPECGNYSVMNQNLNARNLPGDIPLFIELVSKLKPKFFVQDNLPGCFKGVSMEFWAEHLPEYDLYPEWISNFNYGNIQKSRRRFFMIGALKKEHYVFVPGELPNFSTLEEVLRGCEGLPNHNLHVKSGPCGKNRFNMSDKKYGEQTDIVMEEGTWENFQKYFASKPDGHVMQYVTEAGTVRRRIGTSKGYWHGHSHLLDGSSLASHPRRNLPFTIRERARIQGCPDDFIFYGEKLPFNHEKNTAMIKQTGKFMPVQFCEYVAKQIMGHLAGTPVTEKTNRQIIEHKLIDQAKGWYCENVGYADLKSACLNCGKGGKCPKRDKETNVDPSHGKQEESN